MPYVWPTLIFSYTDLWNIRIQHKQSHSGRSDTAPCASGGTRCQDTSAHDSLNYRRKSIVPDIDRRSFISKTFLDNRKLELFFWFTQCEHCDIFLNSKHDTLPSDQIPHPTGYVFYRVPSTAAVTLCPVRCRPSMRQRHFVQGHGKKDTLQHSTLYCWTSHKRTQDTN